MKEKSSVFSQFPSDFQSSVLTQIAKAIKANQSVQLIGPAGSGKTLIIQALTQKPEIRKKYFDGKEASIA